jgi:hypothetical protein
MNAAGNGRTAIIAAILAVPRIDKCNLNEMMLTHAAASGNIDIVTALLALPGVNVNATCYEVRFPRACLHTRSIFSLTLPLPVRFHLRHDTRARG